MQRCQPPGDFLQPQLQSIASSLHAESPGGRLVQSQMDHVLSLHHTSHQAQQASQASTVCDWNCQCFSRSSLQQSILLIQTGFVVFSHGAKLGRQIPGAHLDARRTNVDMLQEICEDFDAADVGSNRKLPAAEALKKLLRSAQPFKNISAQAPNISGQLQARIMIWMDCPYLTGPMAPKGRVWKCPAHGAQFLGEHLSSLSHLFQSSSKVGTFQARKCGCLRVEEFQVLPFDAVNVKE